MRLEKSRFFLVVAFCVSIGGIGCQKGPSEPVADAKVHGNVLLSEKPIGPLSIIFYSDHFGRVAQAQVGKNGEIQLPEAIPAGGYMLALGPPSEGSIPPGIPSRYFIETSSNLHYELKVGDNDLQVQLAK